jgi:hypothetical protein
MKITRNAQHKGTKKMPETGANKGLFHETQKESRNKGRKLRNTKDCEIVTGCAKKNG